MDAASITDWLDTYGRAWEERDPELAASLFTDAATYRETPFDDPMQGHAAIRDYWLDVPRSQEDISFSHQLVATADHLAFVRWWCEYRRIGSGEHVELDGIFQLRFEEDGRCSELLEWWHAREADLGAA